MSDVTADLLADTREYIEEHGWIQNEMTYDSKVCTVGAMVQVLDLGHFNYDPRILAACDVLSRTVGISLHHTGICTKDRVCTCVVNWVTSWNDEEERALQEVLDALAKAEKIERMGCDPDE
jgi:hypothetical protein